MTRDLSLDAVADGRLGGHAGQRARVARADRHELELAGGGLELLFHRLPTPGRAGAEVVKHVLDGAQELEGSIHPTERALGEVPRILEPVQSEPLVMAVVVVVAEVGDAGHRQRRDGAAAVERQALGPAAAGRRAPRSGAGGGAAGRRAPRRRTSRPGRGRGPGRSR